MLQHKKDGLLPESFTQYIQTYLPTKEHAAFFNALQGTAPVSIRLNPTKVNNETRHLFSKHPQVKWCEWGYYLPERPIFTLDPLWHAGVYYPQEASSMFIAHIFQHLEQEQAAIKILDLCAAPGGKSTLLNTLLSKNSLLIANEVIKSRADILSENLSKWGQANCIITNNDPSDFTPLNHYFDVVLADVPCSGEGMFRKQPKAVVEWSLDNVQLCAARQKRIVHQAAQLVKPGGYLIYSTCTYQTSENEDNIAWLQENYPLKSIAIPIPSEWGISHVCQSSKAGEVNAYRFYPHKVQGEGFFVSVLQKNDDEPEQTHSNKKNKKRKAKKQQSTTNHTNFKQLGRKDITVVEQFLQMSLSDYVVYELKNKQLIAVSKNISDCLNDIANSSYIKQAGISLGTLKGKQLIPHHHLAMSTLVSNYPDCINLNKEQALQYLRRENFKPILPAAKGWYLVQYQKVNLGWIKHLGQRFNNYYPKHWRIKHL